MTRYFQTPRPRLFAHRGDSGRYPENTLPAFASALELGIRYLETDVRATKDGHVVIHHDETALRTCGVSLPIADSTLAELQKLDAGYQFSRDGGKTHPFRGKKIRIPTLQEALDAFPSAFFNIEIKQDAPPVEPLVAEVVRRPEREKDVLLASEHDQVLKRLRTLCRGIPTSFSRGELEEFFSRLLAGRTEGYRPPGAALQIPDKFEGMDLVTPESVEAAHKMGLEVHVWTINESADMRRLFAMGVDGLMSDFPHRLMRIASEEGQT